jgi:hypothetical protein
MARPRNWLRSPLPHRMDTTTSSLRPGALWLLAYALLGLLAAACGGRSSGSNATPTLIAQPTPDRTVDAVVRGLVTTSPQRPPGTGTLGTTVATPLGTLPSQAAVPVLATPFMAPAALATTTPEARATVVAAPLLASPTLEPTRPPATLPAATLPPTAAVPTRAATLAPTAVPTRAVAPTAVPTVPRPAPTVPAPPTFGRSGGTS